MKRILSLAIAIVLSCFALEAHEIGTTRVTANVRQDASYDIEIVTDAASLVEKLESARGVPPQSEPAVRTAAELKGLLESYDQTFRRRLVAAFDGSPVAPAIDYQVSGAAAAIKLTGAYPQGALQFEWSYGWTFATYSLTVAEDGRTQSSEWLDGGQRSAPVVLSGVGQSVRSRYSIAIEYLSLGFTHIVPYGLDHMLFVLGIFLLGRRIRPILAQVSAFTVAHSITLALSVYGIVSVSPRVVEPLIAVSIAYVAIENILMCELKPWRVALVFAFGLLHGMGFAGALKELGLPRSEFVTALVTFNLGVEAGQLAVIAAAFLLVGWYCGTREWYRRVVVVPASVVIACTAVYWTVQRLAS